MWRRLRRGGSALSHMFNVVCMHAVRQADMSDFDSIRRPKGSFDCIRDT